VCDANYKFIYIDVGQYGSTNDSAVLNESELGQQLADDNNPLNFPNEAVIDPNFTLDGETEQKARIFLKNRLSSIIG
jgi:hypothetical protein